MMDLQTHFSAKICDAGIKKIMVCGKIAIIMDTESNIHIFDILRNESGSERDLEI
jgi:hypothetical protein